MLSSILKYIVVKYNSTKFINNRWGQRVFARAEHKYLEHTQELLMLYGWQAFQFPMLFYVSFISLLADKIGDLG